jgi:DNA-binding protein HU-beta
MNKTELIDAISRDADLSRRQAEAALDAFLYEVTAGVWAGSDVRITGFGTFKLRERAARRGRNPQTGAAVRIKASKGIGFTPGRGLKADLNARRAPSKPQGAAAAAPKVAAAKTPAKRVAAVKSSAPPKAAAASKARAGSKSTVAVKKVVAAKTPATRKAAPTKAAAVKKTTASKAATGSKATVVKKSTAVKKPSAKR